MFEANVIRSFTWSKRHDEKFRKGHKIYDLSKEDVEYLQSNGVIDQVVPMDQKEIEKALVEAKVEKVEKAVKVTTKKKTTKK